jgi:polar amino acid transport system substrate-binding protein
VRTAPIADRLFRLWPRGLWWAGLLVGLTTAHFSVTAQTKDPVKLCFEESDVRPWRMVQGIGLNFDLINAAALKIGMQVEYVALPWKRCLAELQANEVDGAFAASYTADRAAMGAYPGGTVPDASKRLYVDSYVLVRKKGSSLAWDGKAMSGVDGAIGIQLGYSVGAQLKAMKLNVDDGSQGLSELISKLISGRLGGAAIGGSDAKSFAKLSPALAAQIEILPIPLVEKPYYLLLSHQLVSERSDMAQRLWSAIEKERLTSQYQKREDAALRGLQP